MEIKSGLLYSKDHEWVRVEGEKAYVGITDYAQHALGEIVYVELPSVGDELNAGDVFHQGLSIKTGITMGQASICIGMVLVVLDSLFGERLGWGTLFNMLFIGLFMDILMLNHLVPVFQPVILKLIMMLLGMFVIGVASYFYISAGFGSGPRDGLMVALTKKTGKSVRFIRNSIELSVLAVGFE
jgi:uncharacterized membrane protein YczE